MFRLTREVRFAINSTTDDQLRNPPSNSYGGFPSLTGAGQYLRLQVTLLGELDSQTSYLRNIKDIDQSVRDRIVDDAATALSASRAFAALRDCFGPQSIESVTLCLSPFLSITQLASEFGMSTRLSQKFEFSGSHRLHNPRLSEDENRKTYGKCNNPHGHGHNYELQVTLRGNPNDSGLIVDVPAFERIVKETVIDRFDHKNLNVEIAEFRELIPTVENIAMVIYRLLKNRFASIHAELASVTVWETPKTWCEYSE
jgi:6-pyruvoyltetrahydropterin/6-carboxytetrahydropterin synthase